MNYINRSIEKEIIKLSNSFPAIVITGLKQVRKTTMLRFLSDNMDKKLNYVSLDNLKDRALAIQDPELFLEMYQSLNLENQEDFLIDDIISISKFNFQVTGSFADIEKKEFLINNEKYMIEKTMQTIEFKMNNKGGSLKSEAGMEVNKGSISNRIFDFTDDFTLFLKEEDNSLPYFAINIDNIEDFR